MLTRFLLWAVLFFLVGRAIRSFLSGLAQGASPAPPPPRRSPGPPDKGELMVRDPVCGTFVLPSRSTSTRDRSGTHYFCSDRCRQAYREMPRPA
jgi:uncharacterized protein